VPGVELRALSASSAESAKAAGDKYGVALTYSSVEELAACDEVDLVAVTVKVTHHYELVMAALRAGKMVLCEWPMAATLAEAEQMASLASDGALRTVAGLQARSAPAIRYLRDLIAEGYIGQVLSTTLVASGVNWGATVDSSRLRAYSKAARSPRCISAAACPAARTSAGKSTGPTATSWSPPIRPSSR